MKIKENLRKFWKFVWEDDSLASWIVTAGLAFILIKFLIYPGLGFAFGTTHPIVAVVSGSMEHEGSFDDWWGSTCPSINGPISQGKIYEDVGISREEFRGFKSKNGFNTGDLMILLGKNNIKLGDIIVFNSNSRYDPIIHRVIEIKGDAQRPIYKTKGDHNCASSPFEESIPRDEVIGEAVLRIPWLGYVKIAFVKGITFIINIFK